MSDQDHTEVNIVPDHEGHETEDLLSARTNNLEKVVKEFIGRLAVLDATKPLKSSDNTVRSIIKNQRKA